MSLIICHDYDWFAGAWSRLKSPFGIADWWRLVVGPASVRIV